MSHLFKIAACVISILCSFQSTVSAATVITENFLVNRGGETGSISPWTPSFDTTISLGPASLPSGSIDATEGDYWFKADVIRSRASGGTSGFNAARVFQRIDISMLQQISAITYGGDFFGVAQPLDSNIGWLEMSPSVSLQFRDISLNSLGGTVIDSLPDANVFNTTALVDDYRNTITSIPAGTHYIDFALNNQVEINNSGGSPASARFITGIDDGFLSITHAVPEPNSFLLGAAGLTGIVLPRRRRYRGA